MKKHESGKDLKFNEEIESEEVSLDIGKDLYFPGQFNKESKSAMNTIDFKAESNNVSPNISFKANKGTDLLPKKFNSSSKMSNIISYFNKRETDNTPILKNNKIDSPYTSLLLNKHNSTNSKLAKKEELECYLKKENAPVKVTVNLPNDGNINKHHSKQESLTSNLNKNKSDNNEQLKRLLTPLQKLDSRNNLDAVRYKSAKAIFNLSLEKTITEEDEYLNLRILAKFKSNAKQKISIKKKNSLVIRGK